MKLGSDVRDQIIFAVRLVDCSSCPSNPLSPWLYPPEVGSDQYSIATSSMLTRFFLLSTRLCQCSSAQRVFRCQPPRYVCSTSYNTAHPATHRWNSLLVELALQFYRRYHDALPAGTRGLSTLFNPCFLLCQLIAARYVSFRFVREPNKLTQENEIVYDLCICDHSIL